LVVGSSPTRPTTPAFDVLFALHSRVRRTSSLGSVAVAVQSGLPRCVCTTTRHLTPAEFLSSSVQDPFRITGTAGGGRSLLRHHPARTGLYVTRVGARHGLGLAPARTAPPGARQPNSDHRRSRQDPTPGVDTSCLRGRRIVKFLPRHLRRVTQEQHCEYAHSLQRKRGLLA
jgi:hypothetical protein